MKKYLTYAATVLLALCATACIKESLEPCPPEKAEAAVHIRAEKFLARPPYADKDLEENFNTRIHALSYFLYRDGVLVRQGDLDREAASTYSAGYTLRLDGLEEGSYRLGLAANAAGQTLRATAHSPEDLFIPYMKDGNGDDSFAITIPMEVHAGEPNSFDAVLHRLHGVTLMRFENIPEDITAIEVTLSNVASRTSITARPDTPAEVVKRIETREFPDRAQASFAVGTFATVPGTLTSCRLKLYAEDPLVPVYDRVAAQGLTIEGNQLLQLKVRFPEDETGELEFSIELDTHWDGSSEGGGTVIIK